MARKVRKKAKSKKSATKPVSNVGGTSGIKDEVVFALVGAAGTDLKGVAEQLEKELLGVEYNAKQIVLSELIDELPKYKSLKQIRVEYNRIKRHMKAGTELREQIGAHAVALLGIAAIQHEREKITGNVKVPAQSTAYVLKSLKHPGEITRLREIYGDHLFVISVYEPKDKRIDHLRKRLSEHGQGKPKEYFTKKAEELIDIDEEEGLQLGQKVRDSFHMADFFVSKDGQIRAQLERIVRIIFGAQFETPTRDEQGMFFAYAASLRSADLSRQVGAVIADDECAIVSMGCNEVPKVGGGAFWADKDDKDSDYRDHSIGYDNSATSRREIVEELFESIKHMLAPDYQRRSNANLVQEALFDEDSPALKNTTIASLLEFGRPVHAEMAAITEAAKLGRSIGGKEMYVTTFPCHLCARLIISSGILRVVYIEPYPKSQTNVLYGRMVKIDHDKDSDPESVIFEPFIGVSPSRYAWAFKHGKRKDKYGLASEPDQVSVSPKFLELSREYWLLEESSVDELVTLRQ